MIVTIKHFSLNCWVFAAVANSLTSKYSLVFLASTATLCQASNTTRNSEIANTLRILVDITEKKSIPAFTAVGSIILKITTASKQLTILPFFSL